ncbi:MAG: FAD-binding oxidoreductase [Marinosulfonomonas sp.]|nr:FAD-binding oxidoreductase [Marinosulfonomonas sp.]
MATVDVTVMGAGIFGLTIAYVCASRGAAVRVIDPRGVGAGSSGGFVGALAPHTPERWDSKKNFQLESLLSAEKFWAGVDGISGSQSGYGRIGRLQPIDDDHTLMLARERIDQAKELWRGQAEWNVCSVDDFAGWVPPSKTGLVVYDTLAGRLNPAGALASLAGAVQKLSVEISPSGAQEGPVIWATGYEGLLELSQLLDKPAGNGVKGQATLFDYDAGSVPQLFVGGLHFVPHENGKLAVGSTSERYFDSPDQTDEQLDQMIERARVAMPILRDVQVVGRWAAVRPRAKSRAPILGPYPGREGQFLANGGFKIGFAMAPKIAHVMADLVLDGVDNIPDDFRVEASL